MTHKRLATTCVAGLLVPSVETRNTTMWKLYFVHGARFIIAALFRILFLVRGLAEYQRLLIKKKLASD